MVNLETEIKKLGLSDKETKVYLALLELGQVSPSEVASYSGVNRATTYVILEELKKKGLATSLEKNKKVHFVAEPPERLSHLFEIEKKQLEENFADLKKILPNLDKLYESRGERPKVRFFEGKEGVTSIRDDILKTKTKFIYQFLPLDESFRSFPQRQGDYREKMAKKLVNIRRKTIYHTVKGEVFPKKLGKSEYKFLSSPHFNTEIIIYGNKLTMVNAMKKPIGIIVSDANITKTMMLIFEVIWKTIK
ncbi:hypothetical protein A2567_03105 [Candidatus Azambacteria bacterium RIFOXYD1_FULL_42_11]|uniref:Transcription regulator TrmB N-terminal domain-containing protein n=1 Tax=Candidatus Azambacteria bacterium RIFOXYD1_FULL_42_11 TaxID=1797310 RepID=A0A1F5CGN7_9BACT|nr:MAG: hypothetical protein A2567_03105 [Candidatus Azambacteria bacterium RIFOXYD1_FULL_42_11]